MSISLTWQCQFLSRDNVNLFHVTMLISRTWQCQSFSRDNVNLSHVTISISLLWQCQCLWHKGEMNYLLICTLNAGKISVKTCAVFLRCSWKMAFNNHELYLQGGNMWRRVWNVVDITLCPFEPNVVNIKNRLSELISVIFLFLLPFALPHVSL